MLHGWRALAMTPQHTLRDGLHIRGRLVATVEAFSDAGPWYGNAMAPNGSAHRNGPARSHSDAAEWCERVSGYNTTESSDARHTANGTP